LHLETASAAEIVSAAERAVGQLLKG
jgi:hypothetical protein